MTRFESVIPRLPVRDLPATVDFYTRRLRFQIDVAWPRQKPTFVIMRRGGTRFGFFELNEHQPGPPGYAELHIEVEGVSELHAEPNWRSMRPLGSGWADLPLLLPGGLQGFERGGCNGSRA
jgi:catechol 2,3-dioxygenase-like lactoylglutathione lyase family enzyme